MCWLYLLSGPCGALALSPNGPKVNQKGFQTGSRGVRKRPLVLKTVKRDPREPPGRPPALPWGHPEGPRGSQVALKRITREPRTALGGTHRRQREATGASRANSARAPAQRPAVIVLGVEQLQQHQTSPPFQDSGLLREYEQLRFESTRA